MTKHYIWVFSRIFYIPPIAKSPTIFANDILAKLKTALENQLGIVWDCLNIHESTRIPAKVAECTGAKIHISLLHHDNPNYFQILVHTYDAALNTAVEEWLAGSTDFVDYETIIQEALQNPDDMHLYSKLADASRNGEHTPQEVLHLFAKAMKSGSTEVRTVLPMLMLGFENNQEYFLNILEEDLPSEANPEVAEWMMDAIKIFRAGLGIPDEDP